MNLNQDLDSELRGIAKICTGPFRPEDEKAPVGSEGWYQWAGTVIATAHNTRVIGMDTRNRLLDSVYAARHPQPPGRLTHWVIVVQIPDHGTVLWGPFETEREAMAFEDKELDPPAGSRSSFTQMFDPRATKA